ncbi:metallophosphoesterase [Aeromonas media]|uniref:metallophosphoesterase n=1 Tax=Aeromonas media TaxID=651 RepID=UPI001F30C3DA|nr:metallophosphoesterase [Aeromonas media]
MNYKFVKGSVALAVLAALSGCNISSNDSVAPCTENVCKLTILHTNDTHGRFWHNDKGEYGMAAQKTLVERLRGEAKAAGSEVLVLSGGDVNTGVPESDLQDAEPDFMAMNSIRYDAMAVGNHEFDNPLTILEKQREWAQFPMISANIYDKASGKRYFDPYKVFKLESGLKVAVLGLPPKTPPSWWTPTTSRPWSSAIRPLKRPSSASRSATTKRRTWSWRNRSPGRC